jgi:Transposase DDE domain
MITSNVLLEQAALKLPITTMIRSLMERCLSDEDFNALFDQHRKHQYTRLVLFSTIVTLMTWVVCKVHPVLNAAIDATLAMLNVSKTSIYNKLNGIETQVSAAVVAFSATRLMPIIDEIGTRPPLLPGYQVRIVDGNCIAASEHRLDVLREISSGPLPGKAVVIFDPQRSLATNIIPCEDGHAQERSLLPSLLELLEPTDLAVADRNFCTRMFLQGIYDKGSAFLIREHAQLPWKQITELVEVYDNKQGVKIFEQMVELLYSPEEGEKRPFQLRRIVIELETPTRDGDYRIVLLTIVPQEHADAKTLATLYRDRWTIEKHFGLIERAFASEIPALGLPKAAIFILAIALMAGNLIGVVMSALQRVNPTVNIAETVSPIKIVQDVTRNYSGTTELIEEKAWECIADFSNVEFVVWLLSCAKNVNLACYKKSKRGPKKPQPKRHLYKETHTHVSTFQLLEEKRLGLVAQKQ